MQIALTNTRICDLDSIPTHIAMAATDTSDAFLSTGHEKSTQVPVKSLASHGTDAREQVVLNLCSEAKCDVEPRLLPAALKASERPR